MLPDRRRLRLLAAALAASAMALGPVAPAAASGEEPGPEPFDAPCTDAASATDEVVRTGLPSAPLAQMQIDEVHDRFTRGEGVGVAVIDSGIAEIDGVLTSEPGEPQIGTGPPAVEHGTIVAGLIAGSRTEADPELPGAGMGIAPAAELTSIRVVRQPPDSEEDTVGLPDDQFAGADVIAGLEWVAENAGPGGRDIGVVNLSLTMSEGPALRRAVARVQDAGVVVVAAVGNRSPEQAEELPDPEGADPLPDDPELYPAAYDGVIGVSAYVPPGLDTTPEQAVLASEATDVAAPTIGGVSAVPTGSTCVLDSVATSWATAYVSGVVALLRSEFPDETPEQISARLVATASGVGDERSDFTGAGLVQPLEAMTRTLTPRRSGDLEQPEQADDGGGQAAPPPVREDALADARSDFRWWGLLAGAVLIGAVILRPLLRRVRGA